MSYWIFKVNPNQYRIDERLLIPNPNITLPVTRYHERIQKNDTVFIWRGSTPRGICAVIVIDACPYEPEVKDLNDGFELPPNSITRGTDHWARGRLIRSFPIIEASVVKKIPGLELFSFFSAYQAAVNFSVTRSEGTILLEFIEKHLAEPHEKVLKPTKPASLHATGAKKNKSVGSAVAMLKCEDCGRFVVSSDTERHIREAHAGQPVEWNKTK